LQGFFVRHIHEFSASTGRFEQQNSRG
jgi:hypothetical protein